MKFSGFNSPDEMTAVPEDFFQELLPQIDQPHELKLVLYVLWRVMNQDRPFPFFRRSEIAADSLFMDGLGADSAAQKAALDDALERASKRGVILPAGNFPDTVFLLNSPKGRAAKEGLDLGRWDPDSYSTEQIELGDKRPNIFALYEQNIGPLTPMIAESLREAEAEFPFDWIEHAVLIALKNNVRKWRYVEAILNSWQEKGCNDRRDQKNTEEDRRKYVEGEFSDFIER
jgi:DnaD/phage-associated family protein